MTSNGHWTLTVVRAHGLQRLRTEKSWRPVVSITVGDSQCHELNLGCDGQNPNLRQCFQFHGTDASSQMNICVYHEAPSKKKRKRRNLVATARCTLQDLARLQSQQEGARKKEKGMEIKLNGVLQPKGGARKSNPHALILIAKIETPQVPLGQLGPEEDTDATSEILSEGEESTPSMSDSSENKAPDLVWSETHKPEPKVHTGYWSGSDDTNPEDERAPLLKRRDHDPVPIFVAQFSDSEDNSPIPHLTHRKSWFAASMLPTYTETISVESRVSTVDSIVDSFSSYRTLREAQVDSDYEHVLTHLCTEWRFVAGSLVALSGLEAGVFGFSSASIFTISSFSRKAVAVGSIASGLGLTIDAWFLLVYSSATPAKFKKMALDVYGTYLFFCISSRIPALCLFTSAFALMTFLLSVAWKAWPTAVLVMSFFAGMLVSLQFVVYGVHCIVAVVIQGVRYIERAIVRCLAWIRPHPTPPSDMQEKNKDTPQR